MEGMIQLTGSNGDVQGNLDGGERIYSKENTKIIVMMAKNAKTERDYMKLGEYIYNSTKKQDSAPEEFSDN